jgi:Tfp pilus assembly protein PilX
MGQAMKSLTSSHTGVRAGTQRGVVLFFALITLVVMSLAAVALIRSVDTTTLIAGNLAFKQAATVSADTGVERAIDWMNQTQAANDTKNVLNDLTHSFNNNSPAQGYYSGLSTAVNLTSDATWIDASSQLVGTDASGNTIRFIIQRMCGDANVALQDTTCLFSEGKLDNSGQHVRLPQEICRGSGCPVDGQSPQIRITARVTGPKNTISYVQAFVY